MYVDLRSYPGASDVIARVLRVNIWCECCGEPSRCTTLKDPKGDPLSFWNHRPLCWRCLKRAQREARK
jgi:hypothetical protein